MSHNYITSETIKADAIQRCYEQDQKIIQQNESKFLETAAELEKLWGHKAPTLPHVFTSDSAAEVWKDKSIEVTLTEKSEKKPPTEAELTEEKKIGTDLLTMPVKDYSSISRGVINFLSQATPPAAILKLHRFTQN